MQKHITIVGAGLVGCMLALLLARRGHQVAVYEKRTQQDDAHNSERRSTHLVVSARGWKALQEVGAAEDVLQASLPLRGRRIHTTEREVHFQQYGRQGQLIHAIHRNELNSLLRGRCAQEPGVTLHFGHRCVDVDAHEGRVTLLEEATGVTRDLVADVVFAADGAFSGVRTCLMRRESVELSQRSERYGYKEFTIAPRHAAHLQQDAMHGWPRGEISLFAFPNADGSFTGTLLAPLSGAGGFASLSAVDQLSALFAERFPDMDPLPLSQDILDSPVSSLFTMRTNPWVFAGRLALIGDAAHAMVPFLGQGMNAGFEDCTVLMQLLDEHAENFSSALSVFESRRRVNCDAVTDMSLRAFDELAHAMADPVQSFRRRVQQRMQDLYPQDIDAPYELIAFTHVPYADVLARVSRLDSMTDTVLRGSSMEDSEGIIGMDRLIRQVVEHQRGVQA